MGQFNDSCSCLLLLLLSFVIIRRLSNSIETIEARLVANDRSS
jgi:hypothetical protein